MFKPEYDMFTLIKAAIPNFQCPQHHQQYSLIDHKFNILCESCSNNEPCQQLSTFFEKPIVGLMQYYSPTSDIQQDLLDREFLAKIRKNLRQSQQALNTYLGSLQKAVISQCKFMKETYQKLSQSSVTKIEENLTYLETTNKIYLDHFQEKLGSIQLNQPESLSKLISEFVTASEDPSSSLHLRINNIKSLIKDFPFLKLEELKRLYVQTCDPTKWQLGKFIQNTKFEEDLVIETNLVKLLDRRHLLHFQKDRLQILDLSNKVIGRTMADIDNCFEIPQFRLISHNKDQINIFSYLNPSAPKILVTINAKYPTEIQYCNKSDSIYFISQAKLQRYHFTSSSLSTAFVGKVKQYKIGDGKEIFARVDRAYWKCCLNTGKNTALTKDQWSQI